MPQAPCPFHEDRPARDFCEAHRSADPERHSDDPTQQRQGHCFKHDGQ